MSRDLDGPGRFQKGDAVRVVDGPFRGFAGIVDEVLPERGTVRVMVVIFERATPIEVEHQQLDLELP